MVSTIWSPRVARLLLQLLVIRMTTLTIVIFHRLIQPLKDSLLDLRDLSLKRGHTLHQSTMFNTLCLHMRSSNSILSRRRSDFKLTIRVTLRRTLYHHLIMIKSSLASPITTLIIPEEEEQDLSTNLISNITTPGFTRTPTMLMDTMTITTPLTKITHHLQTLDSETSASLLASFCNNYWITMCLHSQFHFSFKL